MKLRTGGLLMSNSNQEELLEKIEQGTESIEELLKKYESSSVMYYDRSIHDDIMSVSYDVFRLIDKLEDNKIKRFLRGGVLTLHEEYLERIRHNQKIVEYEEKHDIH